MENIKINLDSLIKDLIDIGLLYSDKFIEKELNLNNLDACPHCGGLKEKEGPPNGCCCKHNNLLEILYSNMETL